MQETKYIEIKDKKIKIEITREKERRETERVVVVGRRYMH